MGNFAFNYTMDEKLLRANGVSDELRTKFLLMGWTLYYSKHGALTPLSPVGSAPWYVSVPNQSLQEHKKIGGQSWRTSYATPQEAFDGTMKWMTDNALF